MNLTEINRLSRPKQGVYHIQTLSKYTINTTATNNNHPQQQQHTPGSSRNKSTQAREREHKTKKYNQKQIIDITNRLSRYQLRRGEDARSGQPNNSGNQVIGRTTSPKTEAELEKFNQHISRPLNRKAGTAPPREKPRKLEDMEPFLSRLSTPKKTQGRSIDRFVHIERRNHKKELTKKEISSLCERLADPKYARSRTPDTRRLLDRTFSPVNTYAWQGIAHNNVDWKIYTPNSMLVHV